MEPFLLSICLLLILLSALALLLLLAWIDLRTCLLPNVYVFPFAGLGVLFHVLVGFSMLSPFLVLFGGGAGYSFLYTVRFVFNRIYQKDTLGLGDVKLMAAAGLWLGPDLIFPAISFGALFGVLHGLGIIMYHRIYLGQIISVASLSLPAGPGLIAGILFAPIVSSFFYPAFFWDFIWTNFAPLGMW